MLELAFIRTAMEPTLIVVFLFVGVIVMAQNRAKEKREKLRILEDALRSGHLDEVTKAELVGELTGRRREPRHAEPAASPAPRGSTIGRLLFGLGWLGMILGVGFLLSDNRDLMEAGVIVASIALGLMTLPLAVREYDRGAVRKGA